MNTKSSGQQVYMRTNENPCSTAKTYLEEHRDSSRHRCIWLEATPKQISSEGVATRHTLVFLASMRLVDHTELRDSDPIL